MAAIHKKVITSQKGLRSTGGPDLLKWGLPGGGIKSAKVAPTPYVYFPPETMDQRLAVRVVWAVAAWQSGRRSVGVFE